MTPERIIENAKMKWNDEADVFNQWDNLGFDEQVTLILKERDEERDSLINMQDIAIEKKDVEIDAHIAAEELALARLRKVKKRVRALEIALFQAQHALRHPDDDWRNDVVNIALKVISEALAQKED